MKTWAALISMCLVLLPAGIAQSQSTVAMSSRQGFSGARGGMRRPPAAQQPGFGQRPWFSQRSPSFARSPAFFHSSRFARRVVFVGNQPFFWNGWGWSAWNGWNGWAPGWGPGSGVLPYWWPSPPVASEQTAMWVYCQNPEGFFPYVQDCPSGWIPVVPGPPPAESPRGSAPEPGPMEQGTSSAEIREQIARSRVDATSRVEVSLTTAAGSRPTP